MTSITSWKYDTCCFFDHDYDIPEAKDYTVIGQYIVFGDLRSKFRVVCYGGSTTSSLQGSQWVKLLQRVLISRGHDCCVINGACGGHNSWHEMNKMARDLSILNPTVVVSFSGINDFNAHVSPDNPYINSRGISEILESGLFTGLVNPLTNDSHAQVFIRRTQLMHSVCKLQGAKFLRILQPTMGYGAYIANLESEEDKKCYSQLIKDQEEYVYLDRLKIFYDEILEIVNSSEIDCFVNDTNLFDGMSNLFSDFRHPNEKGYAIIADRIADLLESNHYLGAS